MSKPTEDEQYLIEGTKEALAEVLGREPTKQEVWRVHAGLKRMAFMLLEHRDYIKKYDDKNPDQATYPEDMDPDDQEAANEGGTLGEERKSPK